LLLIIDPGVGLSAFADRLSTPLVPLVAAALPEVPDGLLTPLLVELSPVTAVLVVGAVLLAEPVPDPPAAVESDDVVDPRVSDRGAGGRSPRSPRSQAASASAAATALAHSAARGEVAFMSLLRAPRRS
jgi:hypothetical protein